MAHQVSREAERHAKYWPTFALVPAIAVGLVPGCQHCYVKHHAAQPMRQQRALLAAIVLNAALAIGQIVTGVISRSLAVAADAAHQFVDVLALTIAYLAMRAVSKPASSRRTYGFRRGDSLGAHTSSVLLLLSIGWIGIEAVKRLFHPDPVKPIPMIVIGALGLIINGSSAVLVARSGVAHEHAGHEHAGHEHVGAEHAGHEHAGAEHAESLSTRAARLHLLADAGGSLVVLLTGLVLRSHQIDQLDPITSLVLCALVVGPALRLLRRAGDVLLDTVPATLHVEEIRDVLRNEEGVLNVHHIHVWSLGLGAHALSAHVEVNGDTTIHEGQAIVDRLNATLARSFAIDHATLQIECHPCADPVHT